MSRTMGLRIVLAGLVIGIAACESDTSTSPTTPAPPPVTETTVTFRYLSPVPPGTPPSDPENITGCIHHFAPLAGAGATLEGSWSEELYRATSGSEGEAIIPVPRVPVGQEHVVRVWDLGLCNVDATHDPVTYHTLFANGVELTRVVMHPSGMTGAAFTVASDGSVTP